MDPAGDPRFPTTHWSALAQATGPGRSHAVADLCRHYWYPVYAYMRRQGHSAEDACDLTQGFFTALLASNAISAADPERGRFRSLLLASVRNFLANEWDKSHAIKRGGGIPEVPLDVASADERYRREPTNCNTPERLYERAWAIALLEIAMKRLEAEHDEPSKHIRFGLLKPFLAHDRQTPSTYARIAAELGTSEGAARVAVHRLRIRFGELLREEVGRTLEDPLEADGEIRYLLSLFGEPGAAPARAY